MNGQKTGLSENELSQVSGGVILPEEDRSRWNHVFSDISYELNRVLRSTDPGETDMLERIEQARTYAVDCTIALHYGRDITAPARTLYGALRFWTDVPAIAVRRDQLRELIVF